MINRFVFIPLRPSLAWYILMVVISAISYCYLFKITALIVGSIAAVSYYLQERAIKPRIFTIFTITWFLCFAWTTHTKNDFLDKKRQAELLQNQRCIAIITDYHESDNKTYQALAHIIAKKEPKKWTPTSLSLMLTLYKEVPIGTPIHLSCTVYGNTSDTFTHIMQKKTIHGYGRANFNGPVRRIHPRNMFYNITQHAMHFIYKTKTVALQKLNLLQNNAQELFKTILLGNTHSGKNNKKDDLQIRPLFEIWGISHYLARSGLHATLLIAPIMFLAVSLGIDYATSGIISSIILLVFGLLSWSGLTFLRALIMWSLLIVGKIAFPYTNMLHTFCLCTIAFLLHNPYFLFALDFQLSFGATALLIVVFHTEKIRGVAPI